MCCSRPRQNRGTHWSYVSVPPCPSPGALQWWNPASWGDCHLLSIIVITLFEMWEDFQQYATQCVNKCWMGLGAQVCDTMSLCSPSRGQTLWVQLPFWAVLPWSTVHQDGVYNGAHRISFCQRFLSQNHMPTYKQYNFLWKWLKCRLYGYYELQELSQAFIRQMNLEPFVGMVVGVNLEE